VEWKDKLISLFLRISEDKAIKKYLVALRESNNFSPEFSDEEALTVYIYGILQGYTKVKDIHRYTEQHLKQEWFPQLPSYQAFNNRLNFIAGAFEILAANLMEQGSAASQFVNENIHDSMPIILAAKSRSSFARVARRHCAKGYCSSKDMYYYGLKLHLFGLVNPGTLPMPEFCWFGSARENDLTAARPYFECVYNRKIYADKIYADTELNERLKLQNTIIITPVKKAKGQLFLDAAEALFSTAVSRIRQPIESLFNWLNEKTQIQNATKVRSERGLWAHVWGRLAAAMYLLVNP
jgi:hypothetical protein